MSQPELLEHRAKIVFEVEIILDGYWEKRPPENIKAGILADWADTLQDWTQEQIVWALRHWRDKNPDKRPNPGHIRRLMLEKRGKRQAADMAASRPQSEPQQERVTPERAAQIAAEAGVSWYGPKRFPGIGEGTE